MSDSPFQPPPFEDDLEDDLEDEDDEDDDDLDGDDDSSDDDEDGGAEVARAGDPRRQRPVRRADASPADGGTARAVLEHVARSIVDSPDAVAVEVSSGRSGTKLSLHVDPADMGRIIGKRGRVAQAIRVLVRAAAARDDTDASVDIVD